MGAGRWLVGSGAADAGLKTAAVDTAILVNDKHMLVALQTLCGTQDNFHAVLLAIEKRTQAILELIRLEQDKQD